jgi:L-lactate dehydrogenase complex protein LldG
VVAEAAVSDARELTLDRVRRATAGAPAPEPVARTYRRRGRRGGAARVALLCERVCDYRAEAHVVRPPQLRAAIAGAFARQGAMRIVVPAGVPAAWRPAGLELVEDAGQSPAELDRLDGVLTGCTLAIAETGTIALAAGPAEGRRALTLVPDLHVCVVEDTQIVELVPEAMTRLGELVRAERRPITFISGPSATSDIELNRVEGVHGPRTLIVFVLERNR